MVPVAQRQGGELWVGELSLGEVCGCPEEDSYFANCFLDGESSDEFSFLSQAWDWLEERVRSFGFRTPGKGPDPSVKTIRVRIAVAMGDGKWTAAGGSDIGDTEAERLARDVFCQEFGAHPAVVHAIEATLPLPESVTVEGEVSDG